MTANPGIYTDVRGLAALRGQAKQDPQGAIREAARQFEALFIQNLLKQARSSSLAPGALDGPHSETYQELHDQQLALSLARGKGLGIAAMLIRQIERNPPDFETSPPAELHSPTIHDGRKLNRAVVPPRATPSPAAQAPRVPQVVEIDDPPPPVFQNPDAPTPEEFVTAVWPAARTAAEQLGVDPRVLVAQAALESAWGRSVARRSDGQSSHNLFGIKADSRWDGARTVVSTLEYEDGVAVRRRDPFRSYNSFSDSFADYVKFLQSNPRYSQALKQVSNPEEFLRALQSAGYATDPAYARKVSSVLRGDTLRSALENLGGV